MRSSLHIGRLFPIVIAVAAGAMASCAQEGVEEPVTGEAQSAARDRGPLPDCLYVGDDEGAADQIEMFDPYSGTYEGSFIRPGEVVPNFIRGMVFNRQNGANPNLYVVDQDATGVEGINGEIFRYRKHNGKLRDVFIPSTDPNGAFAPRGTIIYKGILFVADVGDNEPDFHPGGIRMYDAKTGDFRGVLDGAAFPSDPNTDPAQVLGPRGLVIGPDGLLYASVFSYTEPNLGRIVRFDPDTGAFLGIVADSAMFPNLRRPEGLAFGPDGKLYVTSFRDNTNVATTIDQILVFDVLGRTQAVLVDSIALWQIGQPRAFAQALLFGPGGLYVPITGGDPDDPTTRGQLRVYNLGTEPETYTLLAEAGGPLQAPWYLTFCGTNPATLAYEPQRHCACGQ
ncbi:hypothetical protein WME73_45910 [Sorangium sp. So ce302]|uniref:hypothetical protein n=1 Tax=Sorangium sp. So ce302 TaxID=3133297 RepID=UPI003F5D9A4B